MCIRILFIVIMCFCVSGRIESNEIGSMVITNPDVQNYDASTGVNHSQSTAISSPSQQSEYFLDSHKDELINILKTASAYVQAIIRYLKDPSLFQLKDYRYCIFVGPPGSGKTTTAKAIAYQMYQHGWEVAH